MRKVVTFGIVIAILAILFVYCYQKYTQTKKVDRQTLSTKATKKLLEEAYLGINAFAIGDDERKRFQECNSESTYGEILLDSLAKLAEILNPTQYDVFYDFGSGKGQAPLFMALATPIRKCVGIELSTTRHKHALHAREKITNKTNVLNSCKVDLLEGDFTDPSIDCSDATLVWLNSTCYPENVMHKIAERLSKLKTDVRIVTLKQLPTPEKYGFTLVQQFTLPMTWSSSSTAYLYKGISKK